MIATPQVIHDTGSQKGPLETKLFSQTGHLLEDDRHKLFLAEFLKHLTKSTKIYM